MPVSGASSSLCLLRATGNSKHANSCGNVLQTLEMRNGSPLDTNIFNFDSSSMSFNTEFSNPRKLRVTSDGSPEQQGLYLMWIKYSMEDYPEASNSS